MNWSDKNMAQGFEFEISGLEELEKDLTKAIGKCPVQAKETLKGLSKEFKASAKKRANADLGKHERKEDKKKWAIKKKWGSKLVDDNMGMAALIYNSAPHFHLIENGHNKVNRNGQTVGFTEGRHIMEKTRNDYKDIVPERFQEMIDDILKERDLT